ncbi:MAG: class I SAM-dependent methyltransferase [Desulfurococcales archaeon]|nr:class I SAM-dependent methyltransferase [Desulfurococcales archaeon]
MPSEATLEAYEKVAHGYRRKVWPIVTSFLESVRGKVVIDIGCGKGLAGSFWVRRGVYVGIDLSPSMLFTAPEGLRGSPFFWAIAGEAETLPLRDGVADSALMIAVLHHIRGREERVRALREVKRSLRRGGRVLITVWSGLQYPILLEVLKAVFKGLSDGFRGFWRCSKSGCRYYHLYTLRELVNEVEEAGLEVLEAGTYVAPGKGRGRKNYFVVALNPG